MEAQKGHLLLNFHFVHSHSIVSVCVCVCVCVYIYMLCAGVGLAKKGMLAFLVGGLEKNYTRAKPLLECMGKNIIHCGDNGNGQAAKICNNMLLGISMIGTSEALQLAIRSVDNHVMVM